MKQLNRKSYLEWKKRPIKIMQFGEGNFLRAFLDWIIQNCNDREITNSGVVVVQPMPMGRVNNLAEQEGLYTVCLEGMNNGIPKKTRQIVDVLQDFINPYEQYDKFLDYAHSSELQVIVSNTTEAGIVLDQTDVDFSSCPKSFPGKLLAFLFERYNYFNGSKAGGLAIVPCELIDNNGEKLLQTLVELAKIRGMSNDFISWLTSANHFTSTLVDRIVPGYPKANAEEICKEIGYLDNNIVKGEFFHLWVLKKEPYVQEIFPVDKANLNVKYVDDITPYKQRKVKILNGSHTSMVPIAYLCGIDTVGDAMADKDVSKFVQTFMFDIVEPTINLPKNELESFANDVLDRFRNPYIRHELMSIALNSTTKFVTRLLPTYNDYVAKFGFAPQHILFAFAALTLFYKGKRGEQNIALNDDPEYLEFWQMVWQQKNKHEIAKVALSAEWLWKQNLATDTNVLAVERYLSDMIENGMKTALQHFLSNQSK